MNHRDLRRDLTQAQLKQRYRFRGLRLHGLEAFLSQPFHVAEKHAHKPGVWVSLEDALVDVRHILDGAVHEADTEGPRMTGRFSTVLEGG